MVTSTGLHGRMKPDCGLSRERRRDVRHVTMQEL
jgi:hypothetical protein